jgi:hypothetical protein
LSFDAKAICVSSNDKLDEGNVDDFFVIGAKIDANIIELFLVA